MWASGGIRIRKGAELRKREAFSRAARKERSDAAGRGRRPGVRRIPPSHISRELSPEPALRDRPQVPARDYFRGPSEGPCAKNGKYEYCYRYSYIYFIYKRPFWWDLFSSTASFIEHLRKYDSISAQSIDRIALKRA